MKLLAFLFYFGLVVSDQVQESAKSSDLLSAGGDIYLANQAAIKLPGVPDTPILDKLEIIVEKISTFLSNIEWAAHWEDVKEYLKNNDYTGLDEPCVVLNDMLLLVDMMIFNEELTFEKLPTLPLIVDGGHIMDIELDALLAININRLRFEYNNCSLLDNEFIGTLTVKNIDATLTNYEANGTIGESIHIDSTGDARINLNDFSVGVTLELDENVFSYSAKSYILSMSAGSAMVKFEADDGGDLETFINEYLSIHIYDVIDILTVVLNMEGKIYDSILAALDIVVKMVHVTVTLKSDNELCEAVYEKLGCSDIGGRLDADHRDGPCGLGHCLVDLLDLGVIKCLKIIKDSGVLALIWNRSGV